MLISRVVGVERIRTSRGCRYSPLDKLLVTCSMWVQEKLRNPGLPAMEANRGPLGRALDLWSSPRRHLACSTPIPKSVDLRNLQLEVSHCRFICMTIVPIRSTPLPR